MQKLTLYTNPHSRGGMVRWMLEECGADYDTVAVAFGAEIKAPAYRAINPLGKVPALTHGDTVLTETLAIITWLAEHYPDKALIPPAGSDARGEYYRWLCFALHLEYAAVDRWRGVENNAEQRKAIGYGDFDTAFAALQERLRALQYEADPAVAGQALSQILAKMDIQEELDRLHFHIEEARKTLQQDGAIGRRLDFLMQEFNREANTLGSKAGDNAQSQASVELKVLIEQMREQVQNLV